MLENIKMELRSDITEAQLQSDLKQAIREKDDDFDLRDYCIRVSGKFRGWVYQMTKGVNVRYRYKKPNLPDDNCLKSRKLKFLLASKLCHYFNEYDKTAWRPVAKEHRIRSYSSVLVKLFFRALRENDSFFNLIYQFKPEKITARQASFSFNCFEPGDFTILGRKLPHPSGRPEQNSSSSWQKDWQVIPQAEINLTFNSSTGDTRGTLKLTELSPDTSYEFRLLQEAELLTEAGQQRVLDRFHAIRQKLGYAEDQVNLPELSLLQGESGWYPFNTPANLSLDDYLEKLEI